MKIEVGSKVTHESYGNGTVLSVERHENPNKTPLVQVTWDNPELGRFPEDKEPFEFKVFWTNLSDVKRI